MSKLSSVIHRFGAVFLAGGLSSLLILFGATTSVDDIKKFGISLVVAFVSGGIAALEKMLTNDYPVITPIIPLVNNEIATVTSKIAPQATVMTSTTNVPENVTTTTVLPLTTEQVEVAATDTPIV